MISLYHISCQDQLSRTINHQAMDTESSHIIKVHFNGEIHPFYSEVSVLRIPQTTAPHSARPLDFPSKTVTVSSNDTLEGH